MTSSTSPRLWVVATPLGNPGDLSPRAREVLETADLILAEDTRRAGLLFQRCGVKARARLTSFFEHNEAARQKEVLAALEDGLNVALVSDAGTPLLADPGYRLVRACRERGLPVSPVPGPSAPMAALSASGLPPYPFSFLGFLPRRDGEKRRLFAAWASVRSTLVFFESKSRLAESLRLAAEVLGPRELCLARELTKTHEEFILGRLDRLEELPGELLGEITVLLGPPPEGRASRDELRAVLREEIETGGKPKEAARRAAERVQGWSAKDAYEELLLLRGEETDA